LHFVEPFDHLTSKFVCVFDDLRPLDFLFLHLLFTSLIFPIIATVFEAGQFLLELDWHAQVFAVDSVQLVLDLLFFGLHDVNIFGFLVDLQLDALVFAQVDFVFTSNFLADVEINWAADVL